MTPDRGTLAKVDRRILSELDHEEAVQLVKVLVSDAVWSTWRRYCEAAEMTMGRGLAILVHHELASVVEEDFAHEGELLAERARGLNERERSLDHKEAELVQREKWIASRERRMHAGGGVTRSPKLEPAPVGRPTSMPKVGRNDPCPCKSGLKYKRCHGA
jgi:hypothetical protein